MSSHRGRDSTQQKIAARFYWHNIKDDVKEYIKKCDQCQKHGNLKKVSTKLHSIPVINDVMQQIGVTIAQEISNPLRNYLLWP